MSFVIAIAIFFIVLVFSAINVLNEYERVVVFTLGRFTGIKGPGLVLIWPGIQRTRRVDLRVIVLNVPKQDVITRSEEHTSELQSHVNLVCRLLLEKKK